MEIAGKLPERIEDNASAEKNHPLRPGGHMAVEGASEREVAHGR
jgi:hypothetical protein